MFPLTHAIYLVLIAFGVLILVQSGTFPGALSSRDIGPAAFPRALAAIMIALIVVDLVVSRKRVRRVPAGHLALPLLVLVAVATVLVAADLLGLFVVLPFALFAGLWLCGSRRLLANTLYSVLFPALLWGLFDQLLGIPIASF